MLSLGNLFNFADLQNFMRKVNDRLVVSQQNPEYEVELKLDGLAVLDSAKQVSLRKR